MDAHDKASAAADQSRIRRHRSLVAISSSIVLHTVILTLIAFFAPSGRPSSRASYYVLAYLDSGGGPSPGWGSSPSAASKRASLSAPGSTTDAVLAHHQRTSLARSYKSRNPHTEHAEESTSFGSAAAPPAPTHLDSADRGRGSSVTRSADSNQTGTGGDAQIASLGASGEGDSAGMGDGEAHAEYGADPAPLYPASARRDGEQGEVTLRVLVAADGSVKRVEISQSSGFERLDDSALETVSHKWRFEPARRMGVRVESWVVVPIRFRLSEASSH